MNKNNINVDIIKNIANISLSREPVNALSTNLLIDLKNIFTDLENNNDIRLIVLKSTLKHFSAGADLKQRSIMNNKDSQFALDAFRNCFDVIENSSKITICNINGYCLGGGAELSLCFDLRIASDDAIIGFPEVSIGIIPGAGGTQRLPRLIGISNAKYWIYTAKKFTANDALKYNFVNFVYPADTVDEKIKHLSNEILLNSPIGLKCAKKSIDEGHSKSVKDGLCIERDKYNIAVNTKDRKEALIAFIEKRKPIWRNK